MREDTQRHRGRTAMYRERQTLGDEATNQGLPATNTQSPGRDKEGFFPRAFSGSMALLTP